MANYIGVQCPVCENKFTSEDDIVVCPVCGAPHHRTCYQEHGECAFSNLHVTGHVWKHPEEAGAFGGGKDRQGPDSSNSAGGGEQSCPACGASNPENGIFCLSCGARMTRSGETGSGFQTTAASGAYNAAFGGVSPGDEIRGVTARDLALYVGPSSFYFLPRFKAIDSGGGGGLTFNFPALFFNFLYFFYRKMYLVGAAMLAVQLLLQIPTFALLPDMVVFYAEHIQDIMMGIDVSALFEPKNNLWAIALQPMLNYIPFVVSLFLSFFANRLYLSSAVRNIKKIKASCQQNGAELDEGAYTTMLSRRGRTSLVIPVVVCVLLMVAYFAVVYSILLPHMDSMMSSMSNMLPAA